MKYTSQQIIAAIKNSERKIDYGDMGEKEQQELDSALDIVFGAAKEYAKLLENTQQLKVLEAKDFIKK